MWMNSSNPICQRGNLKCLHQCFSFPYQQTWPKNIQEILWNKNFLRDLVIGLFQLSGLPDDPDNLVECFQEIRWLEEKRDCKGFDFARNAVDVDGDGQITKEEFVEKGLRAISIF